MSNVIQLPEKSVREWAIFRDVLAGELRSGGHDEELIGRVCNELREPFLESIAQSTRITAMDPDEVIKQVNAFFSSVSSAMLLHLANLAIRNVELEHQLDELRG